MIAILCILSGIILPIVQKAKFFAKGTVCVANQGQIVRAVELYLLDHDGAYPPAVESHVKPFCANMVRDPRFCLEAMPLRHFIDLYTNSDKVYQCPVDQGLRVVDFFQGPLQELPTSFASAQSSYWYNEVLSLSGATVTSVWNPSSAAVVNDRTGAWHSGRPINTDTSSSPNFFELYRDYRYTTGFADGHVKSITPQQLNGAKGAVLGDFDWILNVRFP